MGPVDFFKFYNINENLGSISKYKHYNIKGWAGDFVPEWKEYLKTLQNAKIIEIGVHGGASLLLTDDILSKNSDNKLYGIDCWENIVDVGINGKPNNFWTESSLNKFINLHKENRLHLQNIILNENLNIELIHGFSRDISIINKFADASIDAIYIDGDHSYEGCYNDIKNFYPKIKEGGMILCDDYTNIADVKKAVEQFCNEKNISKKFVSNKCLFYKK